MGGIYLRNFVKVIAKKVDKWLLVGILETF